MTQESDQAASATHGLQPEAVVAYIQENPEFFNVHSEILLDIEIPHENGAAVSLFDRQISALRDENRRLKSTLNDVITNARSNEKLIRRIHGLVLDLMEATGPHAIFKTLEAQLREYFNADRIAVLIFATPSFVESDVPPEFVGPDDQRKSLFHSIVESGEPLCAESTTEYFNALWAGDDAVGSVALLPLKGKSWSGIVGIQSENKNRFSQEMGTEFLSYISDIVSLIVDPWVLRSTSS